MQPKTKKKHPDLKIYAPKHFYLSHLHIVLRHTSAPDKQGMQNGLPLHAKTWPKALTHSLSLHSSFFTIKALPIEGNWCFLLLHILAKFLCPLMFPSRVATCIPSLRTTAMTNTGGFQVTLFPSNGKRFPPHLVSLVLLLKVMPPVWRLLPSLTGCSSGGCGVTAGFECPSGRWWDRTMEWGGWGYG